MESLAHYELLEPLGEGGMGVVYKARDARLGRCVAVKVLPAGKASDPERRQRFVQEAKAASALNHPNVLTVHEVGTERGVDFIVTEYVKGKTLAELIPRQGLPPGEALRLAEPAGLVPVDRDCAGGPVTLPDDGGVERKARAPGCRSGTRSPPRRRSAWWSMRFRTPLRTPSRWPPRSAPRLRPIIPLLRTASMACPAGFEPATLGLEGRCSSPAELRADAGAVGRGPRR